MTACPRSPCQILGESNNAQPSDAADRFKAGFHPRPRAADRKRLGTEKEGTPAATQSVPMSDEGCHRSKDSDA